MRLILTASLVVATSTSGPSPAWAIQAEPPPRAAAPATSPATMLGTTPILPRDPLLAATLSGLGPWGIILVGQGGAAFAAAPIGYGLGHVYAGEPVRGAAVVAGGYLATFLGAGLGFALTPVISPFTRVSRPARAGASSVVGDLIAGSTEYFLNVTFSVALTTFATMGLYSLFAAFDASQAGARYRATLPAPSPAPPQP